MISLWPYRTVQITPVNPPVMPMIAAMIAAEHGLTKEDLIGPNQTQRVAKARFHAMWECRQHPHLSLQRIGKFFGGRDHTTVINAVRRHAQAMNSSGEFVNRRSLRSFEVGYDSLHG